VHGEYLALARARLAAAAPQLVLLDHHRTTSMGDAQHQLPIFSFLVRWAPPVGKSASANHGGGRFLHFNFVCALLNDMFGIQCRGGCQCAGPYAQRLLGLGPINNAAVEQSLLQDKAEVLRPGFSRLSLPYTLSLAEVEFTVAALSFVAQNGYLFLPQCVKHRLFFSYAIQLGPLFVLSSFRCVYPGLLSQRILATLPVPFQIRAECQNG